MNLLDQIFEHFREDHRSPVWIDNGEIRVPVRVDTVEADLFFSEHYPEHILGYTNYFPPLDGEPENLGKLDDTLMSRNAHIWGVAYAKTDQGVYIIKGDFQAAQSQEEAFRQSDDLLLDLCHQLENLPTDEGLLGSLGLRRK